MVSCEKNGSYIVCEQSLESSLGNDESFPKANVAKCVFPRVLRRYVAEYAEGHSGNIATVLRAVFTQR